MGVMVGRRWTRYAIEAALMVGLLVGITAWQTRGMAEGAAPALAAATLDGGQVDLRALRGRPVLVHFWANWCPICKAEEGSVDGLVQAGDYRVITVAMQSGDDGAVRAHLRERGLAWPVINDANGALAAAWGVRGVPASFVIDGNGAIRFREMGYTSGAGLRLRLWWAGAH